ncbi:MAG: rRNA maturation RNase YbeY [Gammaproteobacteria bacterium]|nr:rRNA maturation RNase YbeY [Gammaproteobacteria bacterium]
MLIEIQLSDRLAENVYVPSEELLQAWALTVFQQQSVDDVELFIRVVDKAESQGLNKDYRNKDAPTNVLSFPIDAPEYVVPRVLGDLVICAEVVDAESQAQDKSRDAHWAHMVVHGILHLLGFDHEDDDQAQQMEDLEIEIIQGLGFAKPYE